MVFVYRIMIIYGFKKLFLEKALNIMLICSIKEFFSFMSVIVHLRLLKVFQLRNLKTMAFCLFLITVVIKTDGTVGT